MHGVQSVVLFLVLDETAHFKPLQNIAIQTQNKNLVRHKHIGIDLVMHMFKFVYPLNGIAVLLHLHSLGYRESLRLEVEKLVCTVRDKQLTSYMCHAPPFPNLRGYDHFF